MQEKKPLEQVIEKQPSEPALSESFYDPMEERSAVERPSFKQSKDKATPAFG